MPEYSMSDFLQGRSPVRQSLQDVWQQMLRNGEVEPSDLASVMSRPTLGGVGGAGGMYLTDRLYHGRSPEEASWRALAGPSAGVPPSWWPHPREQKPLPPSGPQPPSRLREGW